VSFVEALPWKGRRIAVLGGMRELGDEGPSAHAALGARLRASTMDAIVLFGAEMEAAWGALAGSPASPRSRWILGLDELGADLAARLRTGDLVLLKGSRGLEMERVLPRITSREGEKC
jgi:UDP-N-acetylmuramoyl-tripeptide--D-alanyl-D-alanine ligase